jgi:hypothetical protein
MITAEVKDADVGASVDHKPRVVSTVFSKDFVAFASWSFLFFFLAEEVIGIADKSA